MAGEADKPGASAVETLFIAALPLSPTERAAYLSAACGEDLGLRQRVEALLRVSDAPEGFLPERPGRPPAGPSKLPGLLTAPLTEQAGDTIGRYKLREKIGEGGCGIVYLAEQEQPVRRKVALKIIKLGMDTRQVVARFEAERQALALMDHPNIARVLDAGATDAGRPYFVMELVGGIKITDYCDRHRFTLRQRLDLFICVCRAIQHAHQKGIIHRDIKPSNVLVATHDGAPTPKVIDFGIAKATQGRLTDQTVFTAFEQFIGTPAYMSPEQAQLGGVDVDTRSDIYSLGVLLYELLTGKTPFDTEELIKGGLDDMRRTISEKEPERPSTRLTRLQGAPDSGKSQIAYPRSQIDADLDWIVMKCLEKDRARRYETANGLARDIERHLHNEPVVARPPSRLYNLQKLLRRNRLVVTAAAAVLVVLLLGLGGIFSQWRRAEQHAALERKERGRAQTALEQMETIEVRRAEDYYESGDRRNMLPYLTLVLRQNPSNRVAAERLFSALSHRNWARLACPPMTHSNRVTHAAFSHDGRRVITTGADNTAWVWDAETGMTVIGPLTHQAEINSADFSRDDRLVATAADDNTARVWDARTGRPVTEPIQHPARVEWARFSPVNETFVTLCDNRTAQFWDARTGKPLLKPLRHGDGPPFLRFFREAAFSPDGSLLATAASENILRVWSCRTGEKVNELRNGDSDVTDVRFSPDGRKLAASDYDGTARIWDLAFDPPRAILLQHRGVVRSIEFSPDGQRVVTASDDRTAQVWEVASGKPLGPPLNHDDAVRIARFSPEGLRVVSASRDRTVRVWDAETSAPLTEPIVAGEENAFQGRFHPDGRRVLTASNGKAALIFEVIGAPTFTIHTRFYAPLDFSPDGQRMVIAGDANSIRVWDVRTGQPLTPPLAHPAESWVNQAVFSPDGNQVATACDDWRARVWNASDGQLLAGPMAHLDNVTFIAFSPDGHRLLTTSRSIATVWDARTSARLIEIGHTNPLSVPACFSPDGRKLLTVEERGTARVWDSQTGRQVTPPLTHGTAVGSAQFSPDSRLVLTAAKDMRFSIWDAETGRKMMSSPMHREAVLSASFTPNGKGVLISTPNFGVQLWDLQTGRYLSRPFGTRSRVGSVAFGPDETRVGIDYLDSATQIWDAQLGQRLSEALHHGEGGDFFTQFSRDGRRMASSVWDGRIRIWETPAVPLPIPNWVLELAEALAGQRFNQQGVLEPVLPAELWALQERLNPSSTVFRDPRQDVDAARLNGKSAAAENTDFYDRWTRWFFARADQRTVLPSSPRTLAQHAQSLAEERVSYAAAKEALFLQPTNVIALGAVALTTSNVFFADWLSRRARELAPASPGALWARESVLRQQGRYDEALSELDRSPSLWADNPWLWCEKATFLEGRGRVDDALAAYSKAIAAAREAEPEERVSSRAISVVKIRDSALVRRLGLLRRMNRWSEAQRDFLEVKRIPSRAPLAPGSPFVPIDLRPYLNQGLEDLGLSRTMGPTNSRASLYTLAGVQFELCGYVWLDGKGTDPAYPARVLNIQVAQRCRALHFLQSCDPRNDVTTNVLVGSYLVHFAGVADETIPIVGGEDVRYFSDPTQELGRATEAWRGRNDNGDSVRLFKSSWRSPHPEIEITSIDFISAGPDCPHPMLFAITTEQ